MVVACNIRTIEHRAHSTTKTENETKTKTKTNKQRNILNKNIFLNESNYNQLLFLFALEDESFYNSI